jgi:hypothetical protein
VYSGSCGLAVVFAVFPTAISVRTLLGSALCHWYFWMARPDQRSSDIIFAFVITRHQLLFSSRASPIFRRIVTHYNGIRVFPTKLIWSHALFRPFLEAGARHLLSFAGSLSVRVISYNTKEKGLKCLWVTSKLAAFKMGSPSTIIFYMRWCIEINSELSNRFRGKYSAWKWRSLGISINRVLAWGN